MSDASSELLDINEVIENSKDPAYILPTVAKFEGQVYSIAQISHFYFPRRVELLRALYMGRRIVTTKPPTPVAYAWDETRIVEGIPDDNSPNPVRWINGIPYVETRPSGNSLDTRHVENLRGIRQEYYEYTIYGGSIYYAQTKEPLGEVVWDGDIKTWYLEIQCDPIKTKYMRKDPRRDMYIPIAPVKTSFLEVATYEGSSYSRWSEQMHGPTADQIVDQWKGKFLVPCDGGGLFASRVPEEKIRSGDIMIGHWTHHIVRRETMTETLKNTKDGDLQVFFFCAAFMSDEDWSMVRHPFVFVDKYAPRCSYQYHGSNWWSSVPFKLQLKEQITYSNPAYTDNLLSLGKVFYPSEHLHSRYSTLLGMVDTRGTPVSQTWKDFLQDQDRYFALVGMVPIVRPWGEKEPKFTRIIYTSPDPPETGCSSVRDVDGSYYFYYPTPCWLTYLEHRRILQFPSLTADEAVGNSQKDFPQIPAFAWPHINFCLESQGLLYKHIYVDFRSSPELWPYLTPLLTGVSNFAPSLFKKHKNVLTRKGSMVYLRSDIVRSVTYWVYPRGDRMLLYHLPSQDPVDVLEARYWARCWRAGDDYIVGDSAPLQGIFYGESRTELEDLDEYDRLVFDIYDRLVRIKPRGS